MAECDGECGRTEVDYALPGIFKGAINLRHPQHPLHIVPQSPNDPRRYAMQAFKTLILAAALVMLGATTAPALAQGQDTGTSHSSGAGNQTASGNHTLNATEARERHDELSAARNATLAAFKENRTLAVKTYLDALNATRQSFLDAKAKVIADCDASTSAKDNSSTNNSAAGQCVKDGLTPLITKARADIKSAQDAFQAAISAARDAAVAFFSQQRAQINAAHGQGA